MSKISKLKCRRFYGTTSLLAMTFVLAVGMLTGPAFAQEAATTDDIIIFGYRLQNAKSVEWKKNNTNIVDSITQDEMGQLPDPGIADAISRVPGVSTVLDEGVGRYITVRGLSPEFVNLTVDGQSFSSIAAPWDGGTRAGNLEALPTAFFSRFEVIKSRSADMDGDAIGGTANGITRSAYDEDSMYFTLSGAVGKYFKDDIPKSDNGLSYRGSAVYSNTFGASNQFGVVLGADYRFADQDILKEIRTGWHDEPGTSNLVPQEYWNYLYGSETTRKGLFGKLEYKPNEKFYAYFSANNSSDLRDWDKWGHRINTNRSEDAATKTFSSGYGRVMDFGDNRFGTDNAITYAGGFDWDVTKTGKLSLKATKSESTYINRFNLLWAQTDRVLTGSYDGDTVTLDPASLAILNDPSAYSLSFYDQRVGKYDEVTDEVSADWADNIETDQLGLGYKFGGLLRNTTYDKHRQNLRYNDGVGIDLSPYLHTSSWNAPAMNNSFLFADAEAFTKYFNNNRGGFKLNSRTVTNGQDYRVEEEVRAAYAMGKFSNHKVRLQAGLRFEQTEWEARTRYEGKNDAPWVSQGGEYDDWLPSASVALDLTSNAKFRLAYNKSIGRPDGNDLAQAESAPNGNGDIRRGNPDLKPRRADNFDASVEYYFDNDQSSFSFGMFHKDIEDEIFSGVGPETIYGGNYLQNMNAGKATARGFEISFVKSAFDFLPAPFNGLGFSANYTRTFGKMNLVDDQGNTTRTLNHLKDQADHTFNAALLYSMDNVNMRLAYKYTSERQYNFDASSDSVGRYTNDRFYAAYQQWDFHVGYKVLDNLEIFGEVFNITDEDFQWKYSGDRLLENQDHGRTVWVGATYSFQ